MTTTLADRYEALAASAMVEGRPAPETVERLKDELLFQRATQTYLWALPLLSTLGMKTGSEKAFGAGYHVLPVWKRRLDATTLMTTPNADLIHAMSVKGKPFTPNAFMRTMFDRAARVGYMTSRVLGREEVVSGMSYRVYEDRRWMNPANSWIWHHRPKFDLSWTATDGGFTMLDARINFFANYNCLSPALVSRAPGQGTNDMIAFTDGAGEPLSGGHSYRLDLPPNVPAANFWSVALYDAEHSSGLANGRPFPCLGSRDNPTQESDGSTRLYFGPIVHQGKSSN